MLVASGGDMSDGRGKKRSVAQALAKWGIPVRPGQDKDELEECSAAGTVGARPAEPVATQLEPQFAAAGRAQTDHAPVEHAADQATGATGP